MVAEEVINMRIGGTILFLLVIFAVFWGAVIYLVVLLVKSLRKYLNSGSGKEASTIKQSLGETLKAHRTERKMTQEFIADSLGVSRQAVSKWENGTSDPSTSNLIALAKLFDVSVDELLRDVK